MSENNEAFFGGRRTFTKQASNSKALGDNSARVVWHVLGPHQLRRIFAGKQYLMLSDIEISGESSCSVQIKYLLQKGLDSGAKRNALKRSGFERLFQARQSRLGRAS